MIGVRRSTVDNLNVLLSDFGDGERVPTVTQPTLESVALARFVDSLEQKEQIDLVAMILYGRGDFDEFSRAVIHAETMAGGSLGLDAAAIVERSAEKYMQEGVQKLRNMGIYLTDDTDF